MDLKNKKVLLVGLGILGGGLSMAKYLLSKDADLTITDLRDKKTLGSVIKKLPNNISYTLGEHRQSDFEKADMIIFNPAVSYFSEWVKLAQKLKKEFYNDYTFFLKSIEKVNPKAFIIGVTGTRGKTTAAMWASHLIPGSVLGGNIPEKNLFTLIEKKTEIYVLELSSFQLEFADESYKSPNIAVLTNIYVDHLNRYGSFDIYRDVKFNIFKNQGGNDALILNLDEKITKEIILKKPKAHLFFISLKALPKSKNGLYFESNRVFYQYEGKISMVTKITGLAPHEKYNLLAAMLVAHIAGVEGKEIVKRTNNLPDPIFRQQIILKNNKYTIVNDKTANIALPVQNYPLCKYFTLIL